MPKRFKYTPARSPRCPVHGLPLLVKRTVKRSQYRYCPVVGCPESKVTRRPDPAARSREAAHA